MTEIDTQTPLILRTERRDDLLRVAVSIVLLALSAFLAWNEWLGSWVVSIAAVAMAAVGIVQYATGCSSCRIGDKYLEVSNFFRRRRYAWTDVREFHVSKLGPLECVVISLREGAPGEELPGRVGMLRAITRECAIPDNYGMSAGDLAAMLNRRLVASTTSLKP